MVVAWRQWTLGIGPPVMRGQLFGFHCVYNVENEADGSNNIQMNNCSPGVAFRSKCLHEQVCSALSLHREYSLEYL